ncbi:hypothetical protein [Candidatus Mesenet endosymbiont of Phosphuga atrata]|uniref:hypothetical protein n=1 Tax=Candidatus Mesenet endosymbiont of Phosphuga atrata TaxID=3066221 RepID=UPI0030CF1049
MLNQEKPQDFELIELLIREAGLNVGASPSTSTQQGNDFESFKARFQSYIDQIPSYLHSAGKSGFFPHFFLGSLSTFLDTQAAGKLGVEKIYFRFDTPDTLKVVVIKSGEIKRDIDAIKNIKLFSISEHGSDHQSCKFTSGELEDILKNFVGPVEAKNMKDRLKNRIESKLIQISKDNIGKEGIIVGIKSKKIDDSATSHKFCEIEKGLWDNPENDIVKLTDSNTDKVRGSIENILKKISEVHSKYKGSLIYTEGAREAAHHGFIAGALVNFRYRHNLRVYLEQFAERGYADIVLVPRGEKRVLDAIPIIIELKAATAEELEKLKKGGKIKENSKTTPAAALKQAEDYTKGFQPNVMRVLTTADDILCVGVNLDHPSPISDIVAKSRDQKIIPLLMIYWDLLMNETVVKLMKES